jgi:hypothetical protein
LPPFWVCADLTAPPNHTVVTGPLNVSGKQSFQGGILLVPADPAAESPSYKEINEYVATIRGAGTQSFERSFKSIFGQSISGPIANEEAQGILDAIRSVQPVKSKTLSYTMTGVDGYDTVWTLAKVEYSHTHYDIYHITKIDPTQEEELVGYINVEVPTALDMENQTYPLSSEPTKAATEVPNAGTAGEFNGTVMSPGGWLPLPDDGLGPIIGYGHVDVYDYETDDLVACTNVRPGETVSVMLNPGDYDVEAEVTIFGLSFWVDAGHPASNLPFELQVTLFVNNLVYGIIGGLIIAAAVIALGLAALTRKLLRKRNDDSSSEPPALQLEDEDKKPPPDSVLPDLGPIHPPPA